jgi:hypothetical protein
MRTICVTRTHTQGRKLPKFIIVTASASPAV